MDKVFLVLAFSGLLVSRPQSKALAQTPQIQIESLERPPYARPPRHPDDPVDPHDPKDSLRSIKKSKAARRKERESRHRKPRVSWEKAVEEQLTQDALTPRDRLLLVELSLVAPFAITQGVKRGYSHNPTTHFQALWRRGGPKADGKNGLFYGLRLAPFSGTGFYQKKPGSFGLIYFGPVVGWGSLDKAPEDQGNQITHASGLKPSRPTTSGYLFSAGLAALNRQGESGSTNPEDSNNDFGTKGFMFDPPGLWMEYRWLSVHYGGLAVNPFMGVQTGRDKVFVYFGLGTGGWT